MSNHTSYIADFLKVLFKEIFARRVMVTLVFAGTLLTVITLGLIYPLNYVSNTTIHADQQNIIAPLLEGQAEVTRVADQTRIVREVIYSPRILSQVISDLDLADPESTPKDLELMQDELRQSLAVESVGPGFIRVSTNTPSATRSFNVVKKVTELFIQDVSASKRSESREAFEFIDKQVKTYKSQLQQAEERLKAFKAQNTDGTEEGVNARITQLRADIESMELDLEDARTRAYSLETQLSKESRYSAKAYRADVYRERLVEAQEQLATLQLSYKDTYPDIVELKHQISDLRKAIREARNLDRDTSRNRSNSETVLNPLYEQLRLELSNSRIRVSTLQRRLRSTRGLLEEEYQRLKRIAEQDAQLSELTRDYNVNKEIYENMLDRKEKARLSMTLDIEGQGVTYKVQEPAVYPLNPTGPRFRHFVLLAPLLGVLLPIGLLVALIQLDPRVRFASKLHDSLDVPVIGTVPHIHTRLSQRVLRGDMVLLMLFLLLVFGAFIGIVLLRMQGVI